MYIKRLTNPMLLCNLMDEINDWLIDKQSSLCTEHPDGQKGQCNIGYRFWSILTCLRMYVKKTITSTYTFFPNRKKKYYTEAEDNKLLKFIAKKHAVGWTSPLQWRLTPQFPSQWKGNEPFRKLQFQNLFHMLEWTKYWSVE